MPDKRTLAHALNEIDEAASCWVPEARLIGNITAAQIKAAIEVARLANNPTAHPRRWKNALRTLGVTDE